MWDIVQTTDGRSIGGGRDKSVPTSVRGSLFAAFGEEYMLSKMGELI